MAARDETRKIEIIMNGQKANASIKEMQASAKILWNQLRKLPEGSKEFVAKSKEYQQVSNRLKGITTEARGVQKGFQMLQMTAQQFLGVFSGFMIFQKVSEFFTTGVQRTKEFEKSLSELKSITGASTEDMAFYNEEARRMGAVTTKSATEVAQAFTIIGSKKPELLASKESLALVTQETIALAEAANISIPEAADALSQALNKFNLDADQSSRVVNVLAESYRKGSVDIQGTATELAKFGGIANEQGISVEQSASLIQNVGKTVEESGVKIRNVLLALASGADETNPSVVGLDKALENLGKQNLSTAELSKMFGTQNAEGALMMIKNRDEITKMTKAITGTEAAYEMAATNTDNYESALLRLESAVTDVQIGMGEGLLPVLRYLIEGLANTILWLKELPKFLNENKDLFFAFGIAVLSFNTANIAAAASVIAHTVAEKGRMIATKAATAAQWLMNAAMSANPIGLVIKAVGLLTAGFVILYNRSETLRGGVAGVMNALSQLASNIQGIYTAFMSGDFSMIVDSFKNIGNNVGTAYTAGFKEKLDSESAIIEDKEAAAVAVVAGNEEILAIEEEYKAKQVENFKDLAKKKLAEQRALEDLRLALIEDSNARELEKERLKFDRKIEDLHTDSELYLEEKKALEDLKELALQELRDKHEAAATEKKLVKKEEELQEYNAEQEMKLLRIEEAFLLGVTSETEREDAEYKIKKDYAEKKLALLIATNEGETLEVQKAKNALLKLEKEHADDKLETEKKLLEAKKAIRKEEIGNAVEGLKIGLQLLDEDSKARKKAAKLFQAFAVGNIAVQLGQEIQAIWKNANSNWMNALIPGWGPAFAAVQTVAAVGRAGGATKNIMAQKFATGGSTIPMAFVDGMWQKANPVGSFAPGGNVNSTSIGVIGEKGAEWVAPNWMLRNPATANVIGMLEAQRKAGQYAIGGSTQASNIGAMSSGMDRATAEMLAGKMDILIKLTAESNNKLNAWPDQLKVYNVLTEVEDGLKLLQKIRNDGSIG